MIETKEIDGFEGLYSISSDGTVTNLRRNKIVKHSWSIGYRRIKLFKSNIRHYFSVHRLIAQAFIPNPENKPCINHKNGNRGDNRLENLEWCTQKENTQHAWDTGLARVHHHTTQPKGEKHPNHNPNLNDVRVKEIKELINSGKRGVDIAKQYGITKALVWKIKAGYSWAHV